MYPPLPLDGFGGILGDRFPITFIILYMCFFFLFFFFLFFPVCWRSNDCILSKGDVYPRVEIPAAIVLFTNKIYIQTVTLYSFKLEFSLQVTQK